jgi:hypothetical protein
MIFASNNKKATIASGQEIAVPANIQSGFNSGNNIVTNSSIQYKTVALQLEVIPLINSDREVTLDIVQKVDEVSGSTTIDNNEIPTSRRACCRPPFLCRTRRHWSSAVLIRQSDTRAARGVPFLSRIPVLGYLFKNTTKNKERTELVVLIRPVVTTGPAEAVAVRERGQEFLNMESDVEAGLIPPACARGFLRKVSCAPRGWKCARRSLRFHQSKSAPRAQRANAGCSFSSARAFFLMTPRKALVDVLLASGVTSMKTPPSWPRSRR